MNSDQIQGIIKPLVAGIVAYLAGAHILFDAATWNIIITAVVSIGLAVWSGFQHTTTNLVNTVGNMPNTTVVTTAAIANALPDNTSVVSTGDVAVTAR
jgi:hypothetical protein